MPVAEADSFRIKNSIASMHRLTTMILGNESNNKIVPIHDRVCVNSPPYYLNWFESFHILRYVPGIYFVSSRMC